jgi:integrase
MLRPTRRLTDTKIKAGIRHAPEIGKLMLNDGNGLYLQIHNQVPSWLHRYQINGRTRAMGLGRYPEFAGARSRARRGTRQLEAARVIRCCTPDRVRVPNGSPRITSRASRRARAYITRQLPKWRNPKSEAQWTQSLRDYVYPVLGDLPVDVIDKGLVIKALDTVWTTLPVTGERIRARIQKILDYAATMDYRSGDNPAVWTGKLEHVLTHPGELHTRRNFAALPYIEIATFMAKLRAYAAAPKDDGDGRNAVALELLILSNSRTNEVLGGRKEEVDHASRTWTRPASRMKSYKKPHTVMLSKSAMAIVERMMALTPRAVYLPASPMAPGASHIPPADGGWAPISMC